MLLHTVCFCCQLLFILPKKTFVQSIPVHGTDKTNTKQPLEIPGFENIPTYIKQLYAIVSKGKRPDLMHNGDSVRTYFDEGKKILFFYFFYFVLFLFQLILALCVPEIQLIRFDSVILNSFEL